ncbi:hypothetical protein E8E13_003926 [Curvularia kusanoi]|uniref:Uncharacterized protein n=1 Tax=Curvularia kusanoi TaxID=90978 RepID=A0A9P4W9C8_CURKU|nr:hypothetical protein E8E13_003926 [Curvularia kusanoi]
MKKDYDYGFYRSACTDSTFNSTACPRFCLDPAYGLKGVGVKGCGNNQYCCGVSGDCCTDAAKLFKLAEAEVVTTISPSSSFITDTANITSKDSQSSGKSHRALAIGLGVGIGIGGFLLLVLGILFMLKRRARAKSHLGYEKKEEPSEMDGSSNTELPDSSPEPPPTKTPYSVPGSGVVHEIGVGNAGPSTQPVELEAKPRYDWEPRNEPEPRDGGFRPEDHDRHGV